MSNRNGTSAPCPLGDQAVAFALHALEPGEEEAMRIHAEGCRSCRATVRETELVMSALAGTAEQVDPPPRLRANLMAAAARTPQEVPRPPAPAPAPTPVEQHPRFAARNRRRVALVAVAAAVVVGIGGLTAYTVQVQQQRDALAAQAQALAAAVTQLGAPGSALATLRTPAGDPVAAMLVTPESRTVVTAGLAPNDRAASVYVLWGTGDGDPRPLGTFDVTAPEPAAHAVADTDAGPFAGYAVSLEPGRTMPATPTDVVASGPVVA
ncbi:hypothetical protein BJF78_21175 [Pseudonocardia sp. CNS-139]|nr:hypothetical protein BJF78_21175 [Pseudonocardia sp. CNS-139]